MPHKCFIVFVRGGSYCSFNTSINDIHGIYVNEQKIKLCQLADDMTLLLSDTKPFKIFGVWFANDHSKMISLNISAKMEIINSIINAWLPRKLTLKGKVTVVKSLILPHILQMASVIPLSNSFTSKLDTTLFNFLWSNNKHLVSKSSLLLPIEYGGLKMISSGYVMSCLLNVYVIV